MSKAAKIFILFMVGAVVSFFPLRRLVESASPIPDNLGVTNGRLAPCPNSPNCVSTQATDDLHGIAPISYEGTTQAAHQKIVAILQANSDVTLISETPTYIHAEARSALWRFIDDVEFYFDEAENVIHFRSASRLGYGDGGVNRQRMEAIREAFAAAP